MNGIRRTTKTLNQPRKNTGLEVIHMGQSKAARPALSWHVRKVAPGYAIIQRTAEKWGIK